MIWKTINSSPEDVLPETIALNLFALKKWWDILRVHDIKENKNLLSIFKYLEDSSD